LTYNRRFASIKLSYADIVNHFKAVAIFLVMLVVMPVLLFFGIRWAARRWLSTRPTSEAAAEKERVQFLPKISPAGRTYVAVATCISSVVLGVVAIHRGWGSASSIAFNVAWLWFLSGSWLTGDFTREGLKRFNIPVSLIYQDAKQRKPARAPPLARVMNGGGGIMVLAGIMCWFI
jgi:hypothetical protein